MKSRVTEGKVRKIASKKIKTFREQAGMSQARLARAIGITQGHVSKIENKSITLSLLVAYKASKLLNVSMEEICGG